MRRWLLGLVTLAACASSSSPSLDTGLPDDAPADTLTPSEARAACQKYEDLANEVLGPEDQRHVVCMVTAIGTAIARGSCPSTYANCSAQPTSGTYAPVDFQCESAISFAPSGCTATIGELEACVNALAAGVDRVESKLTCGLASDLERLTQVLDEAAMAVEPTTYEACASLSDECIGLLGWAADTLPDPP